MRFAEAFGDELIKFSELMKNSEFKDLLRIIFICFIVKDFEEEELRDKFIKCCEESFIHILTKEVEYGESGDCEKEESNDSEQ